MINTDQDCEISLMSQLVNNVGLSAQSCWAYPMAKLAFHQWILPYSSCKGHSDPVCSNDGLTYPSKLVGESRIGWGGETYPGRGQVRWQLWLPNPIQFPDSVPWPRAIYQWFHRLDLGAPGLPHSQDAVLLYWQGRGKGRIAPFNHDGEGRAGKTWTKEKIVEDACDPAGQPVNQGWSKTVWYLKGRMRLHTSPLIQILYNMKS